MRTSVWTYPWDVADEGVDTFVGELHEHGFDTVDLAANYHAIATLAPRNPRRKVMYLEAGAVFFPARLNRYGRLQPLLWRESAVLDAWPRLAERLAGAGMTLDAWTIGMFQPWLARTYPDTARELPFGDRVYAGPCPANPDVQEYVVTLCADIAEQFRPRLFWLEGIGFPDFAYGWVRERIGIALGESTRFLLSLCFCPTCIAQAARRGIAVAELQGRVVQELEERFGRLDPDPPESAADLARAWSDRDLDFREYLRFREDAVVGLVRAIAARLSEVSAGSRPWLAVRADGLDGLRADRILDVVGALTVPSPAVDPAGAALVRDLARRAPRRVDLILNYFPAPAADLRSDAVRDELQTAVRFGVDQISVYNYGLLKRPALAAIQAALA